MLTEGDKIITHNVGCSDKHFFQTVNYSSLNVGCASLEYDSSPRQNIMKQTARFELFRLDEYLPSEHHSRVGFMKLDIENHETRALKGAEKIIRASQPIIVFESASEDLKPYKYLKSLGYQHFYGFEKIKRWYRRSEWRCVEVTHSNKSHIMTNMVVASPKELENVVDSVLMD